MEEGLAQAGDSPVFFPMPPRKWHLGLPHSMEQNLDLLILGKLRQAGMRMGVEGHWLNSSTPKPSPFGLSPKKGMPFQPPLFLAGYPPQTPLGHTSDHPLVESSHE